MTAPQRDLLTFFDRTEVVNLPERRDRRRQTERELRRHFPAATVAERVRFFEAVRPEDAGPFTNRGVHGAFRSTLEILRRAVDDGLDSVLMLQDDVRFTPAFRAHSGWLIDELDRRPWDLVQIGYLDHRGVTARHQGASPVLVELTDPVIGAHCVGFRGDGIARVVAHLEVLLSGRPGDPLRGPMPIDGAFNSFTWCHPDASRVVPVPSLVTQRSSRSDIRPKRHDRVALLRPFLDVGRVGAEWLRSFRT